ncbi:MAG: VirB3 family type IV secretion system protein [bacterium]
MPPSPPRARIYPSLVRTIHIGGIERNAAGLLTMFTLILLFAFRPNWITPAIAAATLLLVIPVLRRATKRDPQILAVYRSHILRAGIYQGQPPHDHPHHPHTRPTTF